MSLEPLSSVWMLTKPLLSWTSGGRSIPKDIVAARTEEIFYCHWWFSCFKILHSGEKKTEPHNFPYKWQEYKSLNVIWSSCLIMHYILIRWSDMKVNNGNFLCRNCYYYQSKKSNTETKLWKRNIMPLFLKKFACFQRANNEEWKSLCYSPISVICQNVK